jgi:hypothetical protein
MIESLPRSTGSPHPTGKSSPAAALHRQGVAGPGTHRKPLHGLARGCFSVVHDEGRRKHHGTSPKPQALTRQVWKRTEGTGAPRPNLKKTLRPSGKKEMAHAPLKEAVQAAKSQLTIIPFLRTWPARVGFDDVAVDTYDSAVNAISNESRL